MAAGVVVGGAVAGLAAVAVAVGAAGSAPVAAASVAAASTVASTVGAVSGVAVAGLGSATVMPNTSESTASALPVRLYKGDVIRVNIGCSLNMWRRHGDRVAQNLSISLHINLDVKT